MVLIVSVNASVGYMAWEARTTHVTELTIEGAPEGIVFIADPHLKESNMDHMRSVIRDINALHPSVVLIGGDFVYGEDPDFTLQEVWQDIDAPVYAILGNHDYKAGIDCVSGMEKITALSGASMYPESYDVSCLHDDTSDYAFADALEAELERNGVVVLRNEVVELDLKGEPLLIVGVDDGWAGMADPPDVPASDAFTIYLIHEPECRARWDADLIFAGHTHGGQINSPIIQVLNDNGVVELSGYVPDYDPPTYISRGIGTSNLFVDLRFFAPPEIVIINPTESTGIS